MNEALSIRKASKKQSYLRVGMSGVSGSGKTWSALLMAYGLCGDWEKIGVIDTENGSADLYSNMGKYSVITLTAPYTPERYIEAISMFIAAGMKVIIIDSASHEWEGKGGCLEINETLAGAKYKGNSWAAWNETTPRHRRFLDLITSSSAHIITTVRSKTETMQTEDKKVKKVGTKEIQREGFEYELTVNFNLDRENHMAIASKDRTGLFIERDPFQISIKTGEELRRWAEDGEMVIEEPTPVPANVPSSTPKFAYAMSAQREHYIKMVAVLEWSRDKAMDYAIEKFGLMGIDQVSAFESILTTDLTKLIDAVQKKLTSMGKSIPDASAEPAQTKIADATPAVEKPTEPTQQETIKQGLEDALPATGFESGHIVPNSEVTDDLDSAPAAAAPVETKKRKAPAKAAVKKGGK